VFSHFLQAGSTFRIPSDNGSYNLIISVYYCLVDNIMCGNWQGNVMALFSFIFTQNLKDNMYILNMQTPRRKSPVDQKVPPKDDSQKAARKSTASAPSDDADKAAKKHIPTVKRTSGVLGNSNVTNLVKIPPNRKKLTDISTSWTSLPPSLAKLGKV
jgi:hypothetical protein